MKFQKIWIISILIIVCLFTGCKKDMTEIKWDLETEEERETSESELIRELPPQESEVPGRKIYVDICGAVSAPGVYELEEGARVYQVIELAGGLLATADDTSINRAEIVLDGAKIQIYTVEEMQEKNVTESGLISEQAITEGDGKVNINTADVALLITLPGIGESRALDIISYREAHGGFSSIEEIMNVNGIKEGTFRKIENKIKTG